MHDSGGSEYKQRGSCSLFLMKWWLTNIQWFGGKTMDKVNKGKLKCGSPKRRESALIGNKSPYGAEQAKSHTIININMYQMSTSTILTNQDYYNSST